MNRIWIKKDKDDFFFYKFSLYICRLQVAIFSIYSFFFLKHFYI